MDSLQFACFPKRAEEHFSFLAWTAPSKHFVTKESGRGCLKKKTLNPLQQFMYLSKAGAFASNPRESLTRWEPTCSAKRQQGNHCVLWEVVTEMLAAESEVGKGLKMSVHLWKLDLDSGATERWRTMGTQGSGKGHLDATHKDTAQQTNRHHSLTFIGSNSSSIASHNDSSNSLIQKRAWITKIYGGLKDKLTRTTCTTTP